MHSVFISYSHDSPTFMDRILAFSDRLREEGIDCNIDQYEQSPKEGWARWCELQICNAKYVIVVCTENYHLRFNGESPPGMGSGVKWERTILTQELYESETNNDKFIPVIFSKDDAKNIPLILRSVTHYDLSSEEGYNVLYRRLTHQPTVTKPDLGPVRPMAPRKRKSAFPDVQNPTRKQKVDLEIDEGIGSNVKSPRNGKINKKVAWVLLMAFLVAIVTALVTNDKIFSEKKTKIVKPVEPENAKDLEVDYWTSPPIITELSIKALNSVDQKQVKILSDHFDGLFTDLKIPIASSSSINDKIKFLENEYEKSKYKDSLYQTRLGNLLSVHFEIQVHLEKIDCHPNCWAMEIDATRIETGSTCYNFLELQDLEIETFKKDFIRILEDCYNRIRANDPLKGRIINVEGKVGKIQINLGHYHGIRGGDEFEFFEENKRIVGDTNRQNRPTTGQRLGAGTVLRAFEYYSELQIDFDLSSLTYEILALGSKPPHFQFDAKK